MDTGGSDGSSASAGLATFLLRHRAARCELLADRLVAIIESENPGYTAYDVVPRSDLWVSCFDNIRRVLELLALAVDPGAGEASVGGVAQDPAYEAARATGRRRAEQGQPLDDVLRSFRMGGRMIWEDLLDEGRELQPGDVRSLGTALWQVVDQTSAQVAVAYHGHLVTTLRADEQLRAELWEGLLGGRAHDQVFARQARQVLDLPDGELVVVSALGLDPSAADHRLGPHATAWVRRSREVVGLVGLRTGDDVTIRTALRAAAGATTGARVGVSGVVSGLAEVDLGHRQATLARASLRRGAYSDPGFAAFDEQLTEMLLLSAPEISERLVGVWLAPLLSLPAAESRALVHTLEAWVASGGSASRAADRVPCHRNTVLNRLRRVAEVTGRDLLDGSPPIDLDLALRARRLGLCEQTAEG